MPHWVRGEEQAEIIEYPGRPAGVTQQLHLTTLGGSVATPAQGISGRILVVHSFDDLRAHASEARGKIVVFDVPFNENLALNGRAGTAYGQGVAYRVAGSERRGARGRDGGAGSNRGRRQLSAAAHRGDDLRSEGAPKFRPRL